MRTHFDEQLKDLHNELVTMGSMCEEAISLAIRALTENDAALTEKVFAVDSVCSCCLNSSLWQRISGKYRRHLK